MNHTGVFISRRTATVMAALLIASAISVVPVAAYEWTIQKVDDGLVGRYNSLALDEGGHPHISYHDYDPNYDLKYAAWNGTAWAIQTVDSDGNVGSFSSIASMQRAVRTSATVIVPTAP
ncbi:MAG: hypothetical protein QCH35_05230 [Methanomicrobiaceae archaeon]|nr:hypothetical protein [Methanomicrobiaceae archaeon]